MEIPFDNRPELKAYIGKEVILGIRSEDVELVQGVDRPRGSRFQGVVDVIEPMGAETYFYVQTGAHTIVSRSEGSVDHSETGHRLQFEIDMNRVHLFDQESAQRITA